jgi:hypothetical protein
MSAYSVSTDWEMGKTGRIEVLCLIEAARHFETEISYASVKDDKCPNRPDAVRNGSRNLFRRSDSYSRPP